MFGFGKKSGIYMISCRANGKNYIGLSKDLESREKEHFNKLKKGRHENYNLQMDYNDFGCDAFYFSVLETCPEHELEQREIAQIAFYQTNRFGYNISAGGNVPPNHSGMVRSTEFRHDLSVRMQGNNFFAGHTHSEDTRREIAEAKQFRTRGGGENSIPGISYDKTRASFKKWRARVVPEWGGQPVTLGWARTQRDAAIIFNAEAYKYNSRAPEIDLDICSTD